MTDISRIPSFAAILVLTCFMAVMMPASYLAAPPPAPDDYTVEEEADTLEEEMLSLGEDYVDLIDELEDILQEFDEYFEEFGQVSVKEYEKALKDVRTALEAEISVESPDEIVDALDELANEFQQLEIELEQDDKDSKLQLRRLKNLRSLEDDLEDIREQLHDGFTESQVRHSLDAESLSRIIQQAYGKAQKEMLKAKQEYEKLRNVPAIPDAPRHPDRITSDDKASLLYEYVMRMQKPEFDDSLTQSAEATVSRRDIAIELENALGSVETETWNRSEINAVLTVGYSEGSPKSRDLAKEITLVVDETPATITVRVIYPDNDDESVDIISSRLDISLPRENPVSIRNSFGSATIHDLSNNLTINSSFSAIDAQKIWGDVVITNTSGAIYIEEMTGKVNVSNSFGPIEAVYIDGPMDISNSYAPITVKKSSGTLSIKTSGMVSVNRHEGNAAIYSSNGDMDIFGITGDLIAVNSFGQIRIEEVTGNVNVENANAPIEVNDIGGLLTVSNKFAPIVADNIGNTVSIESSNGSVTVENVEAGLEINNRFGEVTVISIRGPVVIVNANAPVSVTDVSASVNIGNQYSPVYASTITGDVKIENVNGSVDVTDIKGNTTVNTTFGLVSGENLKGAFMIGNDNGSVELFSVIGIENDCEVRTSFGNIMLELLKPVNYNVTATTSGGTIDSDIPLKIISKGEVSSGEFVAGKSNPAIVLTGVNSTIQIRTE